MKNVVLILFLLLSITNYCIGQSSLDSLRLVLPLGHTDVIKNAIFSPDEKFVLTLSYDRTARIYDLASGKEIHVLKGNIDDFSTAVFSSNGKNILTANWDKTARIYELASGKQTRVFSGHSDRVNSAVFSPNEKLVLTASSDGKTRIFDLTTGKVTHVYKVNRSAINSAIFSPDGKLVLTANDDFTARIHLINSNKKVVILNGHNARVNSAIFSSDGKFVLTASDDKTARIYDVTTGKELKVLYGHTSFVNSAVFSPDGKLVLTTSWDNTVRIYDVNTGKEIRTFTGDKFGLNSAVFNFSGHFVLASGNKKIFIYDVYSGKELKVLKGHNDYIKSAIFSHNDKLVLTSSVDQSARIFRINSGKEIQILSGSSIAINTAVISPDSKFALLALNNKSAIIYDLTTGKEKNLYVNHKSAVRMALYNSTGKLVLIIENKTVSVYEIDTGKKLISFKVQDPIKSANFSPNSKYVLTVNDNTVSLYDISSGKEMKVFYGHTSLVNSAVFNPDGKLLLTASWDGTARVFDVFSGKELQILNGHTSIVNSSVFSHDGKLALTASLDKTARIFEIDSGKEIMKLIGHTDNIQTAEFNLDSKLVLTASSDNTARIFEVTSGKEVCILKGHKSGVVSAKFSPDGKLALTTSLDNTACVYDVNTGKLLYTLKDHTNLIVSAEFSKNGEHLLTVAKDNKAILWDVKTGKSLYTRLQLMNNNWLIKLPNSPYYMCSKDASKMLHYVTPSLKVIGFEQLDPVYNRPDIVLDSIGKYFGGSDQELVLDYRKAWEKRIRKLGLDKEKLGKGEIAVPNAEIVDADKVEYENKSGELTFKVNANDNKYNLNRFNVYVNEVPVYGSSGVTISHLKKQKWETTINLPLNIGENKIQVSVMNELGLENFKYPTYVNYTPTEIITAKTYYIGIGVNEFKESNHNLKYCVKDVSDLAKSFGGQNTVVKLFTNEQVTKENIVALKDYLSKTSVNDKVIISCSSHGLLDDSLNFYLAMHDVDFNNPKVRGLKYEELENLLDGIPARQKLLLLDACNSGENDKTDLLKKELKEAEKQKENEDLIAYKGKTRSLILTLEDENTNKFRKVNELFVNVRNNTGSVIISAAGGQQSALEAIEVDGKIIENGAFTFSVLEYLNNHKNEKEELTVNKLKQYVEGRVEEITKDKQKPTSRQETMEVDWKLKQ